MTPISSALKSYRKRQGLPLHLPAGSLRPRGEDCPRSKLTQRQVGAIRLACRKGASKTYLAAKYGISRQAIYDILSGRSWSEPIRMGDFQETE